MALTSGLHCTVPLLLLRRHRRRRCRRVLRGLRGLRLHDHVPPPLLLLDQRVEVAAKLLRVAVLLLLPGRPLDGLLQAGSV